MIKRAGVLTVIIIMILSLISGCGVSQDRAAIEESAMAPDENMDQDMSRTEEDGGESAVDYAGKQIIRTANNKIIYKAEISLQTKDFDETTQSIENKVNEVGGYIESSSIEGRGIQEKDPRYAYYVLRIPKEKFEYIKKTAENWGNISSIHTNSEDVTEAYYDIEAKLETKYIQEERLLELLKKADKLEDIIALERELQEVRYQIENNTVTLKKMDSLIDYSTITVNVYEVEEVTIVPDTFSKEMKEAVKESGKLFADFVQNAVISLIYIMPYLVLLIILIILLRKKAFKYIVFPFRSVWSRIRRKKD